jgi:trans-aconitate methyltransferase
LIKRLILQYPGIDVLGIDPSIEMINFSKTNVPGATFIQGDFFFELTYQPDLIISRALGNGILDKDLIPRILEKLISLVRSGGFLIFHSYGPPLLSVKLLEKYGEVIKAVYVIEDYISPFYVIKKK